MSARSAAPKSAPRVKAAPPVEVKAHDPRYTPPEVGVCLNDLQVLASAVSSGFGLRMPENPSALLSAACRQASFELKVVFDRIENVDPDAAYALAGTMERLEAIADSAETLHLLLKLPHLGMAQPEAAE